MFRILSFFITYLIICFSCCVKGSYISIENVVYDLEGKKLPAAIYCTVPIKSNNLIPLVIINNGSGIENYEYSFLAKELATLGFYVISLQHEAPNLDNKLSKYELYKIRKPLWIEGAQNILSLLKKLSINNKNIDFNDVTLIGHSHGGNIVIYFAKNYPELVTNVISLDHSLMPIPKKYKPRILTLRSNDLKPMDGVLPTKDDLKKFDNIKVIKIPNAKHMDYCDRGNLKVKRMSNKLIIEFIKRK